MAILLLIVGILLFVSLIIAHELGHFIVARRNGVEVEEFGIFFPPRLYSHKTKDGWVFSINLIPLGGFVKLKGEHDSDTKKGTFGAASLWSKSKIMVAGVAVNLVVALVLFTVLALVGMPKIVDNQFTVQKDTQLVSRRVLITYVEPGSPAAKAGLKVDDEINDVALPDYSPVGIANADKLPGITKAFAGKTATIYYQRGGEQRQVTATLLTKQAVDASQKTNNPKGYLGVTPTDLTIQRSTWSAPIVAVGFSAQITALTFQGIGHALGGLGSLIAGLVTGNHMARENGQTVASSQVTGPIGIVSILKSFSQIGFIYILFIITYISLILAVMNILPIPPLDGGRLFVILVYRTMKRPLSARREEMITGIGFLFFMALFVLITISDVHNFL
jgi:regulator of sigma E protease